MIWVPELPEAMLPVFSGPARLRGVYGGRGSGKSRGVATMCAVRAWMWRHEAPCTILCGRQWQNSISDSSLDEIKAAIAGTPAERFFKATDNTLSCGNVQFLFRGLGRNLSSLNSIANLRLAWIEEAEYFTH